MKNVYYKSEDYANFIRSYRVKDGKIDVDYIDAEPEEFPYSLELENEIKNKMLKETKIWMANYNDFLQTQRIRRDVQFGAEALFCTILMESLKMTATNETMRKTATVLSIGCFIATVYVITECVYLKNEEREIKKHRIYKSIHELIERINNDENLKKQYSEKLKSLDINTINKYSLRSINNIEKELVEKGLLNKEEEKRRTRKNELN